MSANHTEREQPGIAEAGIEAAKEIVGLAVKVVEELMAGAETVTHRGNVLARNAVEKASDVVQTNVSVGPKPKPKPKPKPGQGGSPPDGGSTAPLVDTQVVSQLFDLAQQALKVAGDAAGRVLQTGLGPIEKMLDRDSHRHDDVWVTIGQVPAGRSGKATFELENAAEHPTEVALRVTNPLASMKGTIPMSQVHFSPNPAHLPAATDDGPGVAEVVVTVDVPATTAPGHYLCIVRSAQVADLTMILALDVV